jgi:peptidoglycan/LPS O-acetylase OafA/YrhL
MTVIDIPARPRSWMRLDGVDILRGLAILFVLMNHVNMRLFLAKLPYTHGLPAQLTSSLVWNGQRGVQMFFAISGFLITSTSLRRWGSLASVSVRDFYLLRIARIAPLLLALLAVLSLLHIAGLRDFVVPEKTGGLGRALLAALSFHVNVLEARRGYLPGSWDVLWSLSVEEVFYFVFPLACLLLGRGKLLIGILAAFAVLGPFGRTALAHGNEVWQEYSYLGGMDAIAFGCLTSIALDRIRLDHSRIRVIAGIGVALLVFSLCFTRQVEAWGLGRSGVDMTIIAVGTCMVIAAAAESGWRSPGLLSPLKTLGERSYEVYLTHMFVVFALFGLFAAADKPLAAVPMLFIGVIVVAGLLGHLVARFYSEPMNRLLRRRWGEGANTIGAAIDGDTAGQAQESS